jgi:hypothetical protein
VSLFADVLDQVTGDREPGSPSWLIMVREVIRVAADEGDPELTAALTAADPEMVVLALAGDDWGDALADAGDEVALAAPSRPAAPSAPSRPAVPSRPVAPKPHPSRQRSLRRHQARQAQMVARFRRGRGRLS